MLMHRITWPRRCSTDGRGRRHVSLLPT
jgi:hypothetical protein